MSTLQNVRDRVRLQMDLDEEDITNAVLDEFVREGFDRTFAAEQRWPFFESSWPLFLSSGETSLDIPATLATPVSLRDLGLGIRLIQIGQRTAEDNFDGILAAATPNLFSIWGGTLYLWPPPTESDRSYELRGYRKPLWTGVAIDELDGDDRLHAAITHYATALAYAQLEDPELEIGYMRRWSELLRDIRQEAMRPQHHEPLILNGGLSRIGRS